MQDRIRILVGVDGSVHSSKALLEAITIAKKFSGFIKVVTIYGQGMEQKAEEITEEAKKHLEKAEIKYDTLSILGSNPARALTLLAKQENFELIIVGSRGLGKTVAFLMGSVSKQVIDDAECNVLIVKKHSPTTQRSQ
jgi:nucleotide-binding universal stress UspA family protein